MAGEFDSLVWLRQFRVGVSQSLLEFFGPRRRTAEFSRGFSFSIQKRETWIGMSFSVMLVMVSNGTRGGGISIFKMHDSLNTVERLATFSI
jgi:hypothetical protein